MKRRSLLIGVCAVLGAAITIFFVLSSDSALLTHPKGLIAQKEHQLMKINLLLMLTILLPTLIFLLFTVWKRSRSAAQTSEAPPVVKQLILWIAPALVVAVMALITWRATHALDPYRPLSSDTPPLTIQVIALDWKWLFIYPEQGIATLNFVQFPVRTPIELKLAADGSPMNSFWIPQLSGQIYAMTGMVTTLHIMADEPGEYTGRAAEINGEGFANMTFIAQSTSLSDFEAWVAQVKQSPVQLTHATYQKLVPPSEEHQAIYYSSVETDLFNQIVQKNMPSMK